jgi:CheY-like chemotaxis protein
MIDNPAAAPTLIVVVEYHPLVAKFYRMALERIGGFRVEVSEDALRVIELAECGEAGLVILDVSLRDTFWEGRPLDGIELSRMIKQRTAGRVPILLATAHAMAGESERMLAESFADGILEKPVYEANLLVSPAHVDSAHGPVLIVNSLGWRVVLHAAHAATHHATAAHHATHVFHHGALLIGGGLQLLQQVTVGCQLQLQRGHVRFFLEPREAGK